MRWRSSFILQGTYKLDYQIFVHLLRFFVHFLDETGSLHTTNKTMRKGVQIGCREVEHATLPVLP